jgi:hypothetical protein
VRIHRSVHGLNTVLSADLVEKTTKNNASRAVAYRLEAESSRLLTLFEKSLANTVSPDTWRVLRPTAVSFLLQPFLHITVYLQGYF